MRRYNFANVLALAAHLACVLLPIGAARAQDTKATVNSPEFLDLLPKTASHFDFKTAEVFKPVP